MSVKCDFCGNDSVNRSDLQFIGNGRGDTHICQECIQVAVDEVAKAKMDKEFKQALEKTRDKHADIIEQLARND